MKNKNNKKTKKQKQNKQTKTKQNKTKQNKEKKKETKQTTVVFSLNILYSLYVYSGRPTFTQQYLGVFSAQN